MFLRGGFPCFESLERHPWLRVGIIPPIFDRRVHAECGLPSTMPRWWPPFFKATHEKRNRHSGRRLPRHNGCLVCYLSIRAEPRSSKIASLKIKKGRRFQANGGPCGPEQVWKRSHSASRNKEMFELFVGSVV